MNTKPIVLIALLIAAEAGLFWLGISFIQARAIKIKSIHNELVAWQEKDISLRTLQDDYYRNQDAVRVVNQFLPQDNTVIGYFEKLESVASRSGMTLDIGMTTPPQKDDQNKVMATVLKLTGKGTFSQLADFLAALENGDQLTIVQLVDVKAPQGIAADIIAEISVKTYFSLP